MPILRTHRPAESLHSFADAFGRLHTEAESHVISFSPLTGTAEAEFTGDIHHLLHINGSAEQRRIEAGRNVRRQCHPDVQAAARADPRDAGQIGEKLIGGCEHRVPFDSIGNTDFVGMRLESAGREQFGQ